MCFIKISKSFFAVSSTVLACQLSKSCQKLLELGTYYWSKFVTEWCKHFFHLTNVPGLWNWNMCCWNEYLWNYLGMVFKIRLCLQIMRLNSCDLLSHFRLQLNCVKISGAISWWFVMTSYSNNRQRILQKHVLLCFLWDMVCDRYCSICIMIFQFVCIKCFHKHSMYFYVLAVQWFHIC